MKDGIISLIKLGTICFVGGMILPIFNIDINFLWVALTIGVPAGIFIIMKIIKNLDNVVV